MSKLTQFNTPIRRWGYCLTVGGSKYRYYDLVAPPAGAVNKAVGINYTDIRAIADIDHLSSRYDFLSGIAEQSGLTIILATEPPTAYPEGTPRVVFGRTTRAGCAWSAYVTEEVDRSDNTIKVDTSPASLSFPCLLHLDMETVYVTGYSSYTLTGVVRGAARTLIQRHSYADDTTITGTSTSPITSEITNWRRRICTVHAVPVFHDGSHGDWIEIYHGVMDVTPENEDGVQTLVSLAPITSLLSSPPVSPSDLSAVTRLARDYHYFAYPSGCFMEHQQEIPISGVGTEIWSAPIDPTLVDYGDRKLMKWPEDLYKFKAWTAYAATSLMTATVCEEGIDIRRTSTSTTTHYRFVMNLGNYPEYSDLDDGSTNSGYTGVYRYVPPRDRVYYPFLPLNADGTPAPTPNLSGLARDSFGVLVPQGRSPVMKLAYPRAYYQRGEAFLLLDNEVASTGVSLEVDLGEDYSDPRWPARSPQRYTVRITSVTPVALPSGAYKYAAKIHSADRYILPSFGDWGTENTSPVIRVKSIFKGSDVGAVVLGVLTSGGGGNVNGTYDEEPIGLNLPSTSRSGVAVATWGDLVLVDEDSLLAMHTPPLLGDLELTALAGESPPLRDPISSLLLASGYVLTMGTDASGYCRMRAMPMSGASTSNVNANFTDRSLLADAHPHVAISDEVVTHYNIAFNYTPDDMAGVTATVTDNQAIRSFGEGSTLDLELRGVVVNDNEPSRVADLVKGLFTSLREFLSAPRRIVTLTLPTASAFAMRLGGLYTFTSNYVYTEDPLVKMTAKYLRLVGFETSLYDEGAVCTFIEINQQSTGYNACAYGTTISSTTAIRFSDNVYTEAINIETGEAQTDKDLFLVGDTVFLYKRGSRDTGVQKVIASFGGAGLVTFTTAHGFVAGDLPIIMEPDLWGGGSTLPEQYLYVANASGILGSSDPGFVVT